MIKTILGVFIGLVFGYYGCMYLLGEFDPFATNFGEANQPELKACTMEAKLCADGSAVGRTGPNCEFAPCPGE